MSSTTFVNSIIFKNNISVIFQFSRKLTEIVTDHIEIALYPALLQTKDTGNVKETYIDIQFYVNYAAGERYTLW